MSTKIQFAQPTNRHRFGFMPKKCGTKSCGCYRRRNAALGLILGDPPAPYAAAINRALMRYCHDLTYGISGKLIANVLNAVTAAGSDEIVAPLGQDYVE